MARFTRVIKGGNFLKPKKWEDWTAEDFVQGIYMGTADEKDLYGKPIHLIKATNHKFTGSNPIITSGDKEGFVPLYNNGSLMTQLEFVEEGQEVLITYKGMAVTSKGVFKGKPCHSIELQVDEESSGYDLVDSDDILG